jgi:hypothetical protein
MKSRAQVIAISVILVISTVTAAPLERLGSRSQGQPKPSPGPDSLEALARDFWAWRAIEQPLSGDDIVRIDRPAGWVPDWASATVTRRRRELEAFESRCKALAKSADFNSWPVPRQVDYRLMGSAIARVRWELDVTRNWQRDPGFYLDQTLGGIFDLLRQPPPFKAARSLEIVRRMESIPRICKQAKENLTDAVKPVTSLAIEGLKDIRPRLLASIRSLRPLLPPDAAAQLDAPTDRAIRALEAYRTWLETRLPSIGAGKPIGRENYNYFLKRIALMPFTPEQLVETGRREWARAVAFQTYEEHRDRVIPPLGLLTSQAEQTRLEAMDELAVRRFLKQKDILTVPEWMQHYLTPALPEYLAPIVMGVTDDLTGPGRLRDNAVSYIRRPSLALGYFELATARDPRVMIVHEGVPGHYFQLALSWANSDPIRRHYYDSGANEGLGFYAEEMMLECGLFDDSPRSREIIYNFARLRALRVEVDVRLALGDFSIAQGAAYLEKNVPMDAATARNEAAFFAAAPGQAIAYQIGKLQILKLLAEARRVQGKKFNLRAFHDFLWQNGNVPIALLRWEYLGSKDEVDGLDAVR